MAKPIIPKTLALVDLHSELDKVREKAKNDAFAEVETWIDVALREPMAFVGTPMGEGYELAMGEIKHYIKQKLNPTYGE